MRALDGLHVAECAAYMAEMPEDCIDLTVTSPPYDDMRDYRGYVFDFESIAQGLWRVTKPGGVVVWIVNDRIRNGNRSLTSFRQALEFQAIGFRAHDVMIWDKGHNPFHRGWAYEQTTELMLVLSKGKPRVFNPIMIPTNYPGSVNNHANHNKLSDGVNKYTRVVRRPEKPRGQVWRCDIGWNHSTSDRVAYDHPAIFPERLAEDHIVSWSNPGDLVFDPMCGSGTVPKMAEVNGRRWLGLDISEEYIEIAKKRLVAVQPKMMT